MDYVYGNIDGVEVMKLSKFVDERGWLCETFRKDEMSVFPEMSYVSMTLPGVVRGPHEHREQTDVFSFIGPSDFKIALWDARKNSPTYGRKMKLFAGENNPLRVIVPPGVVHGYKNCGIHAGIVLNFPDKLYKGEKKLYDIDEIRHEDDEKSPFRMENV